jgi:predicted metalloprotease with PDZ domain
VWFSCFPGCGMLRRAVFLVTTGVITLPSILLAQTGETTPVRYSVSFPNAVHHEAEIEVEFSGVGPGTLELRMSRTSPGRYAVHEFAKNVYSFEATGVNGRAVEVTRPNPHQWNVSGHGGTVRVTYTLFGDRADGTFAQIDETHAHLNMPASFMWARGQAARPVEISFEAPAGSGWEVATQLAPTEEPAVFRAPGLQYFMDSPTTLSKHTVRKWSVPGPNGDQSVRVALQHTGTEQDADQFAAGVQSIVREAGALFGEFPSFDYGQYTFLAVYLPWASGDGMEHRNSTMLTSTASIESNALGLWGTVAHEFIHAWNVERIRPADLEPFDFEDADMSEGLWFAEGFTSYLDDLLLVRAGLIGYADFAARIGGGISFVTNAPGRQFFSPVEMSMQAPFTDRASAGDPLNQRNTFISYYTWGSVVGLGLDLELKQRGLDIDGFLQAVWARHGRTEIPYVVADLERVLAEYSQDKSFARTFFTDYVRGRKVPDFGRLLPTQGMELVPTRPDRAWVGNPILSFSDDGATLRATTLIGSPLYAAGIDRAARIEEIDGKPIASRQAWNSAISGLRAGQPAAFHFVSRGVSRTVEVIPVPDPALSVRLETQAGVAERAALSRWLSPRGN